MLREEKKDKKNLSNINAENARFWRTYGKVKKSNSLTMLRQHYTRRSVAIRVVFSARARVQMREEIENDNDKMLFALLDNDDDNDDATDII